MLTNIIAAKFPVSEDRRALIYLRRGNTGVSRVIRDEDALLKALVRIGFHVVDIASDDLDLILQTLSHAKLVVSIEGSQITHCCYTFAKNCGVLVLQPSDRFTAIHRHWTECVGVNLGFVIGTPSESGYKFSVDEVLRTIGLVLKQIETSTA